MKRNRQLIDLKILLTLKDNPFNTASAMWRFKSPRCKRILRSIVTPVLSPAVLWCVVVIFITLGSVFLGMTIAYQDTIKSGSKYDLMKDPEFLNIMTQTSLQLLASYCTLIPVLGDSLKKKKKINVNHYVFYFATIASIVTTVAAPITYMRLDHDDVHSDISKSASSSTMSPTHSR
ncbi:hypothetical protein B0O99DRAFT_685552 [Bisporella sp. PMI_857]|nr:hypothetical protein B0O99DRAFT_685552 [Bisporella sp. PMI_857]